MITYRVPTLLTVLTAISMSGCNDSSSTSNSPPQINTTQSLAPTPLPTQVASSDPILTYTPRSHNYDDVDGRTYYYIAAVSEEERKQGRAAGDVLAFRYLGQNDQGEFILARIGTNDSISYRYRCSKKCVVIKSDDGRTIAFTLTSIIGSAFDDAMNGRLKKWTPRTQPTPVYVDPIVEPVEESDTQPALTPPDPIAAPRASTDKTSEN